MLSPVRRKAYILQRARFDIPDIAPDLLRRDKLLTFIITPELTPTFAPSQKPVSILSILELNCKAIIIHYKYIRNYEIHASLLEANVGVAGARWQSHQDRPQL